MNVGKETCCRRCFWCGLLLSVLFQQLSHGDWVTLDIVGMNCYAGSSLVLEKLFLRSRVAKLSKKKYAPKNLFQNVEALLFPSWVVLHLYHKFQGRMLNSQFLTCFWASQNKDSPNQIFLVHKLHLGSKSGTSGSSIDFFRPPEQLQLNYCLCGISRLLSRSERAISVSKRARLVFF